MKCSDEKKCFEKSLHYASPAHGGWGVLKIAQLIPESYHLFVSPAACGRHGSLAAKMEGRKGNVSYLHLTEESIVSGGYEQMLMDAADKLLEYLEKRGRRPKVFTIFVTCIDDLLGTDHDAILDVLYEKYSDIRFVFCHMNPTSTDTGIPPMVNIQNKIYSVLEPAEQGDGGINLIGNMIPVRPESEVFEILKQMGAGTVRHITDYTTFSDYQNMAKSRLNMVLVPAAEYASKQMRKKLRIPYEMSLVAFRPENIRQTYERIAEALQVDCPDLQKYEDCARTALQETAEYLQGMPVIVGAGAVTRPFEFARALLENGFTIERIYGQLLLPSDRENFQWLQENYPQIPIMQPRNPKVTVAEKVDKECIAVGYNPGYLSGARHVVNLDGQNGLYGYQGVVTLMEMIRKASDTPTDLKKILEDTVLVV